MSMRVGAGSAVLARAYTPSNTGTRNTIMVKTMPVATARITAGYVTAPSTFRRSCALFSR